MGEAEAHLLFEVADGILISISEEVEDAVFDVILLQVVHQVSAIALPGRVDTDWEGGRERQGSRMGRRKGS